MTSANLLSPGDELRKKFLGLERRSDIAELLEIEEKQLIYHLYIASPHQRYKTFNISKRSGSRRLIEAPITPLKMIQSKLNQILQYVYKAKPSVHGFIFKKSILTNARVHLRRKHVLNVDLKDFFPSINFGRVRGLFISRPYNLNEEVATVLAQICCHNNHLPQGAPTSPIISNMICAQMDDQLQQLAKKYQCLYTRYADDITISTHLSRFPEKIAKYSEETDKFEVGLALKGVIENNGFQVNQSKIHLQAKSRRQQVTGLTVNQIVNVKRSYVNQVRAMLHAWDKFSLELAENEHIQKYSRKKRHLSKDRISFKMIVKGKIEYIGMVRGHQDAIYLKFYDQYCSLAGIENKRSISLDTKLIRERPLVTPLIITEGKTDWKHLKLAFQKLKIQGLYNNIDIRFKEFGDEQPAGSKDTKDTCKKLSGFRQDTMMIFVFDNDEKDIVKDVMEKDREYKSWGNNVFSFVIPVPNHRVETPEVCIELYYKDPEITRTDNLGRRLFLSNEFRPRSGRHLLDNLICTNFNKIRNETKLSIVDDQVLDAHERNVALSKSDFADYVLNQEENFDDLDVYQFKLIFDIIQQIINENS